MKKVSVLDDNCVEKLNKQPNFYTREGEIKSAFYTNKPMILLMYKKAYYNSNDLDHVVHSMIVFLLQEFDDIFLEDVPNRLPP